MMIGTMLGGRYEIIEEVGKGGMAYVYKAHCHMLNRTVAVKVLRNDLEGGDEFIERFNREAQSAAGLAHPNIVSIYDVGEDKGNRYIVMEYVNGITLKEYIKEKGYLHPEEAAKIASQICSALEAAHAKNIIHRDIKPHNILITPDNVVKVTDFGIARASNSSTLQVGDSILGSVHYISPEQARGGYVDCKTDIYSLGILLYELITGRVPFDSDSPIAIAMKHLDEKPVLPREINPEIPEQLQEIVLKAMAKETRNRYQTVTAMKNDLEAIMPVLKGSAQEESEPVQTVTDETIIFKPVDRFAKENQPVGQNEEIAEEVADGNATEDYDSLGDTARHDVVAVDDETTTEETEEYDDEYDDDDVSDKKSVVNMVFAAVLIAFLLVGGASLGITYLLYPDLPIFTLFSNEEITVPSYEGMDYDKATERASKEGIILEIGDKIESDQEENIIVKQNIAEGRKVKRGSTIVVYVSKGPGEISLDDYVGTDAAEAIKELKAKGYKITKKEKSDIEIAKGSIIKINQNGSKLTIYVSSGYDDIDVIVPNVVGKSLAEAQKMLQQNSLTLGRVEYVDSDIYDAGTVINQSVANGEKISAKTPINITVAGKQKDNSQNNNNNNNNDNSKPSDVKTSSRTLSIGLPSDRASVGVKVVANSNNGAETIFNSTINTAEKQELVLKVSGSTKVEYSIYFDGALASSKTIDFSK